jgi:hypothetical protein
MTTRPASSTAAKSVNVPPMSMPMRYMAQAFARERFAARGLARRAGLAVTKPLATSEARALASRFAGGP